MLAHLVHKIISKLKCVKLFREPASAKYLMKKELRRKEKGQLLDGKLAAAVRGSKLSKNEGSCNSITCKFFAQNYPQKQEAARFRKRVSQETQETSGLGRFSLYADYFLIIMLKAEKS